MPIISAGTSATFTIPVGKVANLTGVGVAVLVYPTSSPLSINGSAAIGPFDINRIVTVSAQLDITYDVEALPPSAPFSVDDVRATRAQAQDGMAKDVLSSPSNVAQQIAATLPPGCSILQFGSVNLTNPVTNATSASAATPVFSADPISIFPKSPTSRLIIIASWSMQAIAEAADTTFELANWLYYFNGTAYVDPGNFTRRIAVGGASSVDLKTRGVVSFNFDLGPEQRRTDNQRQWMIRPYVQSISGAAWSNLGGNVLFIEVDTADTTTAVDSVETLVNMTSYGQSLGAGSQALPTKTTTAVRAGRALMPNAGVRPLGAQTSSSVNTRVEPYQLKSLVDLFEQTVGSNGETPSSAAAFGLTGPSGLPSYEAVVVSNHSIGGATIQELSAGTAPYLNLLDSIRRSRILARRNGLTHRAGGMWFTQGEANILNSQDLYLQRLLTLQASLTTDVRAIDREQGQFPIFLDQNHNWTSYNITESAIPLAQLQAAQENPGRFYLVGPKYMLQTVGDGTHLTADASAWLGSYQGEIARRVLVLGEQWRPTQIESAVRSGSSVLLTYYVPNGQLVIDTILVTDPGNNGFRWIQTGGNSVAVTAVTVVGPKQIRLTLSAVPTGTSQQVGYADIGVSGAGGGPLTGPRGNVRDQATATGLYGETLYNWAVVQRKDVS